jgi:hypothetical protein
MEVAGGQLSGESATRVVDLGRFETVSRPKDELGEIVEGKSPTWHETIGIAERRGPLLIKQIFLND